MSSDDPTGAAPVPPAAPQRFPGPGPDSATRAISPTVARQRLDDQGRREAIERSRAEPPAELSHPPAEPPAELSHPSAELSHPPSVLSHPSAEPTPDRPQDATAAMSRPSRVERSGTPTTVLPGSERRPPRPAPPRPGPPASASSRPAGQRRARLALQRLDPWSVFLFSLLASICLGIVLLVAVAALYAVLSSLGVFASINEVLGEITGEEDAVLQPVITSTRVLGATAVLAAVDVVLLTALATLGALLYNACAALTGGIEVVLGERD